MFRWLVGLGPVSDDDTLNERNRWCAVLASWNPPGSLPCSQHPECCSEPNGQCSPHTPPTTAKCYTTQGEAGTSSSNLSWGAGVADAIDNFIQDRNTPSLGHRKWLFNPPLGPIGIGYYAGGGGYGRAQCTAVFGSGGGGPNPAWIAFPPPGFGPISVYGWTWSFHANTSLSGASASVTRRSDSTSLNVNVANTTGGYGSYSVISITPSGWSPQAGEIYDVTVSGFSGGPVSYELRPVACN